MLWGWFMLSGSGQSLSERERLKIRLILHQPVEKYIHRVARIYCRIAARCNRDARITNTLHPDRMIDTRCPESILAKVQWKPALQRLSFLS